jgi:hypothetical protein
MHQSKTLLTRVSPALIIMEVAAMVGEGIRTKAQEHLIIRVEEQEEEEVLEGLAQAEGGDQVLSLTLSTL